MRKNVGLRLSVGGPLLVEYFLSKKRDLVRQGKRAKAERLTKKWDTDLIFVVVGLPLDVGW